jgi:hypothetical protein
MTRAPRRLVPILLVFLLLAVVSEARGTIVYVQRIVTSDPGDVSLGDLVQARGDVGAQGREALAQSVAVLADAPFFIPTSLYRDRLEEAFGNDAIVVGSRSLVIPRGTLPEGEAFLLDRLGDYLSGQGVLSDQKTEVRFTQNIVTGTPPQSGIPVFSLHKSGTGSVEVSFFLGGDPGNSVTGRVLIPVAAGSSPGSGPGLKTGTPVQVVFHKGLITIEMPGRTLGPSAVGDKVTVFVPESQRSFSGRVVDGKAVSVDLP